MTKNTAKGPGSFCVPRTAIQALLDARATALEICAYLALACYTNESGCYSSASISAVYKATGASKLKGGTIERAIARLKTIRAQDVGYGLNSAPHASPANAASGRDLGPILFDREAWEQASGEQLPEAPFSRARIRHVLPAFDEPIAKRVWFGNNLVTGVGEFPQPLRALKNAGDAAARMLLLLYAANDMEAWGGVPPDRGFPWLQYKPVAKDITLTDGGRLIRAKRESAVTCPAERLCDSSAAQLGALAALESTGLIYQVTMVLNRAPINKSFSSGQRYSGVHADAEPLYELDALSAHGYKPQGEEGLGSATAQTAGELGYSVADDEGKFNGTYAAFVPSGFQAMIVGIYRLRFRVANTRNAGVSGAWARIHQSNREALAALNTYRRQKGLSQCEPPWQTVDAKRSVDRSPPHEARTLQCVQ